MKNMAKEGGLDFTAKKFTNHSVSKTAVRKLKKAEASSREIMAITGRKNEQSLADYDNLDSENHLHLGEILSGKKSSAVCSTQNSAANCSIFIISSSSFSHHYPWYFKTVM